jgi:hypothetical protein
VLEASFPVLIWTASRLDNAVEGDERLDHDGTHIGFSLCGVDFVDTIHERLGRNPITASLGIA